MSVEMMIHGVGQAEWGQPVVVLKDPNCERYLIISIGPLEMMGIAAALYNAPPPRPMTHDLLYSAIAACGAKIKRAVLESFVDGAFHARLVLDVQGRRVELDSRSSDAIAIAVRAGIPVLVEEAVLERAGITPQTAAGTPAAPASTAERDGGERIGEEQLGVFRDVIRGLNLDDFGHSRSAR